MPNIAQYVNIADTVKKKKKRWQICKILSLLPVQCKKKLVKKGRAVRFA